MEFPEVKKNRVEWKGKEEKIPWQEIRDDFKARSDIECKPITWIKPGVSFISSSITFLLSLWLFFPYCFFF